MKSLCFAAALLAAMLGTPLAAQAPGRDPGDAAGRPRAGRDAFHFPDVTLTDGDQVYEHAQVYVRVRPSGEGYTRADYLDRDGRRIGFYEAFQVVSQSESDLRAWAVRNFPDRTTGAR